MAFTFSHTVLPTGQALIQKLVDWEIREIPKDKWSLLASIERPHLVRAIFASGDSGGATKNFEGIPSTAAMDVVLEEDPTKLKPREPSTNIYHYVFESEKDGGITQWGESRDKTILPHWPTGKTTEEVLKHYRKLSKGPI